MKNFISRKFSLLFFMVVMLVTLTSTAQPSHKPFQNNYETFSQMWNAGGTTWYYGTITFDNSRFPIGSNVGQQKDSAINGLTLATTFLTPGLVHKDGTVTNIDSVVYLAVPGDGGITFTTSLLRASATASTVNATVVSSSDGYVWSAVPGLAVGTLIATSLTVPITQKWTVVTPIDRYYGILFAGDGTNKYCAQAWYDFKRQYHIELQK